MKPPLPLHRATGDGAETNVCPCGCQRGYADQNRLLRSLLFVDRFGPRFLRQPVAAVVQLGSNAPLPGRALEGSGCGKRGWSRMESAGRKSAAA